MKPLAPPLWRCRKALSILLLLAFLPLFCPPAWAESAGEDLVSEEAFAAAIEAINAEYGTDLTVSPSSPMTHEEAEVALDFWRNFARLIHMNKNGTISAMLSNGLFWQNWYAILRLTAI